jgi:hypothetical protein
VLYNTTKGEDFIDNGVKLSGKRTEKGSNTLPFSVLFVFGEGWQSMNIHHSFPEKEGLVEGKSFKYI